MRGEVVQRWCAGEECRAGTELQVQGCRSGEVQEQRCSRGAEWVQWFSRGGCTGDCVQVQRFCKGSAEVVQRCRCRCRCRDSAEFCRGAEAHTRCYGTELQRR